jgi:hypothetical protein
MPDAPNPIQEAVAWHRRAAIIEAAANPASAARYTRWADAIDAQAAEIGRLRSIVRVNLLRHVPGATHEAITQLIAGSDTVLPQPAAPRALDTSAIVEAAKAVTCADNAARWRPNSPEGCPDAMQVAIDRLAALFSHG